MSITKLLVANRGEIARRVMRTARAMGISTVAVYSEADRSSPFALEADTAVCIGPAPAGESYLDARKIIEAAKRTGAEAIHPGYGFLAENAGFAESCDAAGIIFVGPGAKAIAAMGSKIESKKIMTQSGVPVIPAYYPEASDDLEKLSSAAEKLGYPILVKASAGGGGKGMRIVREPRELEPALESCRRESEKSFGDGALFLEKYFIRPRHVEFQVFGDKHGNVVHIFERECSIQRRHQKIVEETPSVAVDENLRRHMGEAAVAAAKAIGYFSAGTVEFILDNEGQFYFLEMNTRLQVEHPVTELTTGLDLVEWQILVAQGEKLPLSQDDIFRLKERVGGCSIECRIYAEDPENDFLPATGEVLRWEIGEIGKSVRYDTGIETGSIVGTHYDPILAKVIAHGRTRIEAAALMAKALKELVIHGVTTNLDFLERIISSQAYVRGEIDTEFLERNMDILKRPATSNAVLNKYAAVAAIYQRLCRKKKSRYLPSLRTGFRNVRWRDQDAVYDMPGGRRTVYYRDIGGDRYRITADGVEFATEILGYEDSGRMRMEIGGVQDNFVISCRGNEESQELHLHGPAGSMVLRAVPRFPDLEVAQDIAGGCKAPMPGSIVKVMVSAGDIVKKNDPLIIMEAMKMEHTIFADMDGTVKEVRVVEGDNVDAGNILVVLDKELSQPEAGEA